MCIVENLGKTSSTTRREARSPFSPSLPPNSESLGHVPSCLRRVFTALTLQEEARAESNVTLLRGHARGDRRAGLLVRRAPSLAPGTGDREREERPDQAAQSPEQDARRQALGSRYPPRSFLFLFSAGFLWFFGTYSGLVGKREAPPPASDGQRSFGLWAPTPAHLQAPPPLPRPALQRSRPERLRVY